ncbi:integral membrane protein [Streptomyces zinciresistens K42]|uniref:Integral membrane protein n=1 Tax=Streptomyces zinciresistens K42 TaxID=700597 RepID=G2GI00_9ACTN|nr:phosphatase PAP2 family protein [Streptomyces zinciresistens]EGX56878.1 integral membrane protein [Streptomyces zinciresistens K42]
MRTQSVTSPPSPPAERRYLRWTGGLALASLVLLVLVAVRWSPLMSLDGDIANTTHGWAVDERGVTQVMRILTDWVWDPWTMRIATFAAAIWLAWRKAARWTALWLLAASWLATGLQQIMKALVDRARPVWPDPVDSANFAAYPSGHAMVATVVCGLLLWLAHHYGVRGAWWRTAVVVAVVSAAGAGLTRVWLGVHWLSDVVGGWLLGVLFVLLAVRVHERLWPGEGAAARAGADDDPPARGSSTP